MAYIAFVSILIILVITESSAKSIDENKDVQNILLSKSLGFAIRPSLQNNYDEFLSPEYQKLYQDMLRASKESHEKIGGDEANLEESVGKEQLELMMKGLMDYRRSAARIRTSVGRRRVRSQSKRRQRLNSQSLQSHQRHIIESRRTTMSFDIPTTDPEPTDAPSGAQLIDTEPNETRIINTEPIETEYMTTPPEGNLVVDTESIDVLLHDALPLSTEFTETYTEGTKSILLYDY